MAKWYGLAALIVGADQLTKWLISISFSYAQRLQILPIFDLTLVYNTGAAFSFLGEGSGWQRWLLIAIALIAIVFIIWLIQAQRDQTKFVLALTLILGGAVGNLIDRVVLGHVVDFLLLHWQGRYFPAFNVADMAITLGAILILWDEWVRWRNHRHKNSASRSKS